jgi:hypothetical protein
MIRNPVLPRGGPVSLPRGAPAVVFLECVQLEQAFLVQALSVHRDRNHEQALRFHAFPLAGIDVDK